jgi:hypothetical protein
MDGKIDRVRIDYPAVSVVVGRKDERAVYLI